MPTSGCLITHEEHICCHFVNWGCKIHQSYLFRGVIPHRTSVICMTLNQLMVRLQSWYFKECKPFHCHYTWVHSDPDW